MSERTMRGNVVRWLRELDAVAVENPCHPGTPDVNYVSGWIELKQAARWPANDNTPLRLDHFTNVQRIWLQRRHAAGGRVFLLLQVGKDWLLFDGAVAAKHVGSSTRAELFDLAGATFCGNKAASEGLLWLLRPLS